MDSRHLKFKHPFTATLAGPTSCGKTFFIRRLLEHYKELTTIQEPQLKVMWAYGQWQDLYNQPIQGVAVTYSEGLPAQEEIKVAAPHIVVIDDLMADLAGDKRLSNLYTRGSHHLNISIVFITQNFFNQGKEMRNVTLNSHYVIAFKNPRDRSQMLTLGRQIYPSQSKFFLEAFQDATKNPYSYLIIDLRNDTPEELRLRTRILPEESINARSEPIVYKSKQR